MKTIILVLIGSALLVASCSTNEGNEIQSNDIRESSMNVENDHVEKLQLNQGEKWKVNEEMMPFIKTSEELIINFSGSDYKNLATELKAQNKSLISSCTMTGEPHDELHKWLHPHLDLVKALESAESEEEANSIITDLNNSFILFNTYFQ